MMLAPPWMFPLGTVCVLAGQQGIGKGTIIARIAADLSREHGVIFLSEEDSAEATIKPRIQAAGGNVDRVFLVEALRDESMGGVLLPRDTDELGLLAVEAEARLLVVDPWTNHVAGMDVDKGSIRTALMPLKHLAEEQNLVALLSAHPVKSAGRGDPLSEIAHASAVSQVARAVYWVLLDPAGGADQKTNPHRLCAQVKNNLTARGDTLRYRLDSVLLPATDGEPEMSIVAAGYEGTSETDYWSVRKQEQQQFSNDDTETARCGEWLRDFLADGPQESGAVLYAGQEAGFAERTIKRAREHIGATSRRGRVGSPSVWSLPSGQPVGPSKTAGPSGPTVEERGFEAIPARAPSGHSGQSGQSGHTTNLGPTVFQLVLEIDTARTEGRLPTLDAESWDELQRSIEGDESGATVEMLRGILGGAQ